MGQGSGVDDYALGLGRLSLQEVYQVSFAVGLKGKHLGAQIPRPCLYEGLYAGQRLAPIDGALPPAEQVQVGPVKEQYLHSCSSLWREEQGTPPQSPPPAGLP